MPVHRPAADGHRVGEAALHQVLLPEQIVAHHSPAAAPAGHHPHPVHGPMPAVRELARVLDVIPNPHHDGQQLEADALVIADHLAIAAPFDPPVAVLPTRHRAVPQLFLGDFARPHGRGERHRTVMQPRRKQDAGAQRALLRLIRRQRFAELPAPFAARAHFRARLKAETGIACAIAVHRRADAVEMFALVAARRHFGNAALLHIR